MTTSLSDHSTAEASRAFWSWLLAGQTFRHGLSVETVASIGSDAWFNYIAKSARREVLDAHALLFILRGACRPLDYPDRWMIDAVRLHQVKRERDYARRSVAWWQDVEERRWILTGPKKERIR